MKRGMQNLSGMEEKHLWKKVQCFLIAKAKEDTDIGGRWVISSSSREDRVWDETAISASKIR